MRVDDAEKVEKAVESGHIEKKKVDLLETLKSSHKSIEEFKLAFEKARQQLEKQALKDEAGGDTFGRRGKKKKGETEPEVIVDDKHGKGKKKKRKKAKVDEKRR